METLCAFQTLAVPFWESRSRPPPAGVGSHPGPAASRPPLVAPAHSLSPLGIFAQGHFYTSLWHAWLCPHRPVVPRDRPGLRSWAPCGFGAEPQCPPARLPGAGPGWSQVPVTRREVRQQHSRHPTCGLGASCRHFSTGPSHCWRDNAERRCFQWQEQVRGPEGLVTALCLRDRPAVVPLLVAESRSEQ